MREHGQKGVLTGQRALVTGASSGIGRGVALALARAGADVVVNWVSGEAAAQETVQALKALGVRAIASRADVSDEAQVLDAIFTQAVALSLREPQGPVHFELPPSGFARAVRMGPGPSARVPAPRHDFTRLCDALRVARRPLLLCGLESPPAASSLRSLALPTITTYKAKGVVDERAPWSLGAAGLSPRADRLLLPLVREADLVLLAGYDEVELRAAWLRPFAPDAKRFELTACPHDAGAHAYPGELAETCAQLLSVWQRPEQHAAWRARVGAVRAELRAQAEPGPGFSPQHIVRALSRHVPSSVPIAVDTGAHRIVLSQGFEAQAPRQLLQSNGLCTMGYALPAAIGASLARGAPALAVMGDGGLEMVAGELATLRDLALPVVLVVFDDRSLSLIELKQRALGLPGRAVWSGQSDQPALAHAFGGVGVRVCDEASLVHELGRALARTDRFTLISCALERGAYEGLI